MRGVVVKELLGKQIQNAQLWPDDEGSMALQLEFFDGSSFCFTVDRPKLVSSFEAMFYKDFNSNSNGKNLTQKILKQADK